MCDLNSFNHLPCHISFFTYICNVKGTSRTYKRQQKGIECWQWPVDWFEQTMKAVTRGRVSYPSREKIIFR